MLALVRVWSGLLIQPGGTAKRSLTVSFSVSPRVPASTVKQSLAVPPGTSHVRRNRYLRLRKHVLPTELSVSTPA